MEASLPTAEIARAERIQSRLGTRNIVLVGMMGAGKTSIGRRLAQVLHLPFVDADAEIEKAANLSIAEIFTSYGETHFREGERRVLARLLSDGPKVLATGGGAFMCEETRRACAENGVTIWLKADLPVLLERVRKKGSRPLLQQPDPEAVMRALLAEREPIYGMTDLTIVSGDGPHNALVGQVLAALDEYLDREAR